MRPVPTLASALALVLLTACASTPPNLPPADEHGPVGLATDPGAPLWIGDLENLAYNNPFGQALGPAWVDGKKVWHYHLNFTTEKPAYETAEQYVFVYEDEYTKETRTVADFKSQPRVGQPVVFDSKPGDADYSAIWHNNWVVVPRDYVPDTIRSVEQLHASGYRIVSTPIWVN